MGGSWRSRLRRKLANSSQTPSPPPPHPPRNPSTGITRYTPNTGTASLRAAIAAKLASENGLTQYAPGDVVVSNGAKQAIWQALLAACNPGDHVLIPAPYWVSYPEMARLAGAEPVVLPSTAEGGFLLTPEVLKAAITPASRLLILCTPSNPSGAVYSKPQLEALAAVIAPHPRLLVLSDEIYEYIVYPPAQHVSFGSLPGMAGRTLTVNGFSKAYAMTGWRLGYLAAPPPYAAAAAVIQSQSTSGASSIAQHAGLAALEKLGPHGGAPVAEMVAAFQARRDFVCARLRALPGVRLPSDPAGAFYALFDVSALVGSGAAAKGFGPVPDVDALCRYFVESAGVALVPGDAFGAPNCVRLSYAAGLETLGAALDRLEKALGKEVYTPAGAAGK
jgi:aspartate/glutamate/aspartate-prephenate aminotransferase